MAMPMTMRGQNGPAVPGLDFERRTGVKTTEIDDFLARAAEVEQQIQDIKSGKTSLEDLQAKEDADNAEKRESDRKREQRRVEMELRKERESKQAIIDEHDHWWEGASVMFGDDVDEEEHEEDLTESSLMTAREAALQKYENNYARWSDTAYDPDDPATLAEAAEMKMKKEGIENAEFEKNNTDFCTNFLEDQKKREESAKAKDETAASKRLRGNRYFKARRFEEALGLYRDSLKVRPYERATLLNIAQVYLKQREFTEALEFASRSLKISKTAPRDFRAKLFSRRAAALEQLGRLDEALDDCEKGQAELQSLQKDNNKSGSGPLAEELQCQLLRLRQLLKDATREEAVVTSSSNKEPKSEEDHLQAGLKLMEAMASAPPEQTADLESLERALAALKEGDNNWALAAVEAFCNSSDIEEEKVLAELARALQTSPDARVLLRVRGGLEKLCICLGAKPRPDAGAVEAAADGAFDLDGATYVPTQNSSKFKCEESSVLLSSIAAAVRGEPKSKWRVIDLGVLDKARDALLTGSAAAGELVSELCSVDAQLDETRAISLITADLMMLKGLVAQLYQVALEDLPKLASAAHAAKAIRDLTNRQKPRAALLALQDEDIVEGLARLVIVLLQKKSTNQLAAAVGEEAVEYCVAALANLAMEASARPRFTEAAIEGACDASSTPCGALLAVARDVTFDGDARSVALAALCNACLGVERACAATEAAGGLAVVFALVCRNREKTSIALRTRAAQLLGRLVTGGSAARTLRSSPKALSQIAAAIKGTSDVTERDALVRCLAAPLANITKEEDIGVLVKQLHEEHDLFLSVFLEVVPAPRTDLGEVTAESVCLPYNVEKPPATTVANAMKTLITALSSSCSSDVTAGLAKRGAIERLVALVSNYSDPSVRRNAAVVMAKMISIDPELKERVRDLRGMEMITTLGSSLL